MKKRIKGLIALCMSVMLVMSSTVMALADEFSFSYGSMIDSASNPISTTVFYEGDTIASKNNPDSGGTFVVIDESGKIISPGSDTKYNPVYRLLDLTPTFEQLSQRSHGNNADNEYYVPANKPGYFGYDFSKGAPDVYPELTSLTKWEDHYAINDPGVYHNAPVYKLFIKPKAINFILNYHANTGTGSIPGQNFKYSASDAPAAISDGTGFSKPGFTLSGWNTKSDGSGIALDAGASKEDFAKAVQAAGLKPLVNRDINYNNELTIDLYAQWEETTYKIEYYDDTNKSANDTVFVYNDIKNSAKTLEQAVFTKENHYYNSWKDKDGNLVGNVGAAIDETLGNKLIALANSDNIIKLYADWSEYSYSLRYHGNDQTKDGLTFKVSELTDETLVSIESLGESFKKAFYSFTGWNDENDISYVPTAKLTDVIDSLINAAKAAGNGTNNVIDLNAAYNADSYIIVYHAGSETGAYEETSNLFTIEDIADTTFAKADSLGSEFTKEGFEFSHWSTADSSNTFNSNQTVASQFAVLDSIAVTDNVGNKVVHLYANYKEQSPTTDSPSHTTDNTDTPTDNTNTPTDNTDTPTDNTTTNNTSITESNDNTSPQTSDNNSILLWIALTVVSGAGIILFLKKRSISR